MVPTRRAPVVTTSGSSRGTEIVLYTFTQGGKRGGLRLLSDSLTSLYDSRELVGLPRYWSRGQSVFDICPYANPRCRHSPISWPPLCIVTRNLPSSAPIRRAVSRRRLTLRPFRCSMGTHGSAQLNLQASYKKTDMDFPGIA